MQWVVMLSDALCPAPIPIYERNAESGNSVTRLVVALSVVLDAHTVDRIRPKASLSGASSLSTWFASSTMSSNDMTATAEPVRISPTGA